MSESWASGPPESGIVLTEAEEKEIDANVEADFWHTGEHFRDWLGETEESDARVGLLISAVQYAATLRQTPYADRTKLENDAVAKAEELLSEFRDDCRDDFVMVYIDMLEDQIRTKDDQGEDE